MQNTYKKEYNQFTFVVILVGYNPTAFEILVERLVEDLNDTSALTNQNLKLRKQRSNPTPK